MMALYTRAKDFLAVLLSVSFLWTAMACVSLCLLHGLEQNQCAREISDNAKRGSSFEIETACQEDSCCEAEFVPSILSPCCESACCPVQPMPAGVLQKTSAFNLQTQGDNPISSACVFSLWQPTRPAFSLHLIPSPFSDPPLERLCALRI